jgi:hypothetical protein
MRSNAAVITCPLFTSLYFPSGQGDTLTTATSGDAYRNSATASSWHLASATLAMHPFPITWRRMKPFHQQPWNLQSLEYNIPRRVETTLAIHDHLSVIRVQPS